MEEIKVFAPATVANLSCGFDVLGCCLDSVGDQMLIRKVDKPGVFITKIEGQDLLLETEKNVAGVAALKLLEHLNIDDVGFEIEIVKRIKPGSGIGSSAASSAGAVYGINKLLNEPLTTKELVPFAMEGERLASGTAHADNVAPALLGGFTFITGYEPLHVEKIETDLNLYATVIHPQIEVKTADSRSVVQSRIDLKTLVRQSGYLGGLIIGMYTQNYNLIKASLHDEVVEPYRSILIPEYHQLKEESLKSGALGCGISGSGPSVFALSKDKETANKIAEVMKQVYSTVGVDFDVHVSVINKQGIKVLDK